VALTAPVGVRSGERRSRHWSNPILPVAIIASQSRIWIAGAQRLQTPGDFQPVKAIPISDQIAGRLAVCEGFDDLLRHPCRGRVIRHVEVQHLATAMLQHNEDKQYAQPYRWNRKEINRHQWTAFGERQGRVELRAVKRAGGR